MSANLSIGQVSETSGPVKKARRETQFGHKVYLTTGKSGLILDCMMPRGNPNDSSLVGELVERQKKTLEKPPGK